MSLSSLPTRISHLNLPANRWWKHNTHVTAHCTKGIAPNRPPPSSPQLRSPFTSPPPTFPLCMSTPFLPFWLLQSSYFAIFFYKREGVTRLWRNLPIWVKVARFNHFFLKKVNILSLKSNTTNISLGQHLLKKRTIGFANVLIL